MDGLAFTALIKGPHSFIVFLEGGLAWSPTARVQRGSSETARCTSTGDHLVCPLMLLLRARVPGAQDQRGCPSHPSDRARSASKKGTWPLPTPLLCASYLLHHFIFKASLVNPRLRASNEGFLFPFRTITTFPQGSRRTVFHCAHRTSTVSSCAFCEQERWFGGSLPLSHLRQLRKVMRKGLHPA